MREFQPAMQLGQLGLQPGETDGVSRFGSRSGVESAAAVALAEQRVIRMRTAGPGSLDEAGLELGERHVTEERDYPSVPTLQVALWTARCFSSATTTWSSSLGSAEVGSRMAASSTTSAVSERVSISLTG